MLQADSLITEFVEQSKSILRDNLVGIYLHGSAGQIPCFMPREGDRNERSPRGGMQPVRLSYAV